MARGSYLATAIACILASSSASTSTLANRLEPINPSTGMEPSAVGEHSSPIKPAIQGSPLFGKRNVMANNVQIGQQQVGAALPPPPSMLSSIANAIWKGIVSVFKGTNNQPPALRAYPRAPEFGQRFAAEAPKGTTLHGYRILGDKAKGVEPGFIAQKDWQPRHDKKLMDPGSTFNQHAAQWLRSQISLDVHGENESLKTAIHLGALEFASTLKFGDPRIELIYAADFNLQNTPCSDILNNFDENSVNEILQGAIKNIVQDHDKIFNVLKDLYKDLKESTMATLKKFTKNHYFKLDYIESDKIFGKYTIPRDKAKSLAGIPFFGKLLHQLGKRSTPREINRGAVNEQLANELLKAMGMKAQRMEIIHGSYQDGTAKLLLRSEHIEGFNDFDGEKNATQGAVYIKDGVLVRNTPNKDNPKLFDGPPRLHREIDSLGRNKIMMLLMADRDAIGSKGGNKGYVADQFFAIDPGHALENRLLAKRGDIRSDLSFDSPSIIKSLGYKNFSIFDQATFSEKMEGVRKLQHMKLSGEDLQLFDEFAEKYNGGENNDSNLDFSSEIRKTKELYFGRRDDILSTFASRLAVDQFTFGEEIDADPVKKTAYRDQTLNLLDGLEKLTSTTVGTANGKKNGIRLDIPQVQNPEYRKTWNVKQSGDQIKFTFKGDSSEAAKIIESLQDYTSKSTVLPAPYVFHRNSGNEVILTVKSANITQAQEALSYSNIMNFKHP